jgi:hypothetical protein
MNSKTFLLFSLLLFLFGCATREELTGLDQNNSVQKSYQININQADRLVMESIRGLNLEIKSRKSDNQSIEIEFSKPISAFSWGEMGSVSITNSNQGVIVSVKSIKRMKTQITGASTNDFAKAIFEGVDYALARR